MRALILDPALHSMGGHHYSAMQRLMSELTSLGVQHEALGSANADDQVKSMLGVRPCFTSSVYGRTAWTHQEFLRHVEDTGTELARYLRWKRQRPDLLILPCCDQVLALALAKYIGMSGSRWQPHILSWLLLAPNPQTSVDDPSVGSSFAEYRQAFTALKTSIGDHRKLTVYCETESMAKAYREATDIEIAVAFGPNLVRAGDMASGRRDSEQPTIVSIGYANAAKGYALLPGSIERVLQVRPDVRFMIHGTRSQLDVDRDLSTFETLSHIGPQVLVNSNVLTNEEYLSWLQQADLVLLPYDPYIYSARGSGVFAEATTLGIPIVATSECGFAQPAFAQKRAVPIERYDCDGIAEATLKALTQLPSLTEQARVIAQAASNSDTTNRILAGLAKEIGREEGSRARYQLR
jgi:glycosyltransferase involved in cell wall biosynthesis